FDFTFRIFMDVVFYAINIAFFKILFLHTGIFGGWTESQMMIFVGTYLVVDAIYMCVMSSNLWMFPQHVNKGDLDYYLVRPVSSLFFLSLREFAASSTANLFLAIGVLAWAIRGHDGPL